MNQPGERPSFWKSPFGIVCAVLAVAASIYLYVAHKSHLYAVLPYLVLAACPLMHMFMHRGHGHGQGHGHAHGAPRGAGRDEPGAG